MFRSTLLAILSISAVAFSVSPTGSSTVDLGYAKYRGYDNGRGVDEFLGLRFAAPPIGDLRWRAPVDPRPVEDIQNATTYRAVCVGGDQSVSPGVREEDCLFLNVFTPSNATAKPDAKLPVWVFIQGGAWQTNANGNYNGTEVIVQSGYDIVHVNINYRVAQLGFLGGLTVGEDGGDYNVGMLDQWKALEWVQKYIHLFGGDPEHVVIHGTSAGAGSISHLLTAYDGADNGLFAGVIGDAVAWNLGAYPNDTEPHFAVFSSQMGCGNATDQMACLRATDIDKIQAFNRSASPPPGVPTPMAGMWFSPLIDGVFVTGPQQDSFEEGRFVKVPTMIGDATNEGNMFAPNLSTVEEVKAHERRQYANLSDAEIDQIVAAYDHPRPLPMHAAYFSVAADIMGEGVFICPGNSISMAAAKHLPPNMIWNYRWNTTEQGGVDRGWEVWHCSDVAAIFGPDQLGRSPGGDSGSSYYPGGYNAAIVPVIRHYYISFVKHLDPNVERYEDTPTWENWGSGTGRRLLIQTNQTAMEDVPQGQVERCEMWWSLNDINKQ